MKFLSLIISVAIIPAAIAGNFFGVSSTNQPATWLAARNGFDCSFFHSSAPVPQKSGDSITLDNVLKTMDGVATTFRTAQAEFEWDNYQKVIDEVVDVETGTIYYRRSGKDIEMMANVKKSGTSATSMKPEQKYVLFSEGKVRMYTPKTDQVNVYDLGKNRSDFESFIVLGFGGSGQDLLKTFDVTLGGTENINGVKAAKLELVPKSEKVRDKYNKMILWIDPDKGISLQQQFFTPQGDSRLCKYSSIRLNEKIGDDAFKLKTTGKTQVTTSGG